MYSHLFNPKKNDISCMLYYYYFALICMHFRANTLTANSARSVKYFTSKLDYSREFRHSITVAQKRTCSNQSASYLYSPANIASANASPCYASSRAVFTHHASLNERIPLSLKLLRMKHKCLIHRRQDMENCACHVSILSSRTRWTSPRCAPHPRSCFCWGDTESPLSPV